MHNHFSLIGLFYRITFGYLLQTPTTKQENRMNQRGCRPKLEMLGLHNPRLEHIVVDLNLPQVVQRQKEPDLLELRLECQ